MKTIILVITLAQVILSASLDEDIAKEPRNMYYLNVGQRVPGDVLDYVSTHHAEFPFTPMPLDMVAVYPKHGEKGKTLTYIKGQVSFSSGTGYIKLSSGGVGQTNALVTMHSPMCKGYFHVVEFYAKP